MKATHCPTCKRRYKTSDKAKAYRKALRAEKQEKSAAHRQSTGEIYMAITKRAAGRCEYCDEFPEFPLEFEFLQLDHWLGGSGRRREKQSVENTWLLCRRCHANRTANYPSAAFWNKAFALHCQEHGYPFTPHIEKQPLPKRSA